MGSYDDLPSGNASSENRRSVEKLEERAAVLDSQAEAIKRQAASIATLETQINQAIAQHRSEIDLLCNRLEALEQERAALFEKAEIIRKEAAELRDQAFECEAEIALSRLEDQHAPALQSAPQPPPARARTTGELDASEPAKPGPVPEATNAHTTSRAY